ncbi:WXG100 family type VII secretion target [Streptomyces sp. CG4]|uniref:WXG100 family type VII secretion target n=1 Tax=Streptomyces sp. CG4 TaxID=408783 RepID=UPI0034E1CB0E
MTKPQFDFSHDSGTQLAKDIESFNVELSKRIGSLNQVVDMVQAGWQGAAGKEFDSLQRGINQNLRKLQDNLSDLEDIVRMSTNKFSAHEQERIAEIRKVDNSGEIQSKILGQVGVNYS